MDLYYKQEVTVGVLVLAAAVAFFAGLSWLTGKSVGRGAIAVIPVRFADVSGLQVGDPVQISGVQVGRVARVRLEGPEHVLVDLEIRRSVMPHADAAVKLSSLDFFGAQRVDYDPGTSPEMLPEGQEIIGRRETQVTESASSLADQAAELMTGLQDIASESTAEELRQTLEAAQRALDAVTGLGDEDIVSEAAAAMRALRSAGERLDSTIANPAVERSVSRLDDITEGMSEMAEALAGAMQAFESILAKIDRGEGSLGRLVNDTTLTHDMHEVMVSLKLLLDDVRERPGRYIHIGVF